MFNYFERLYQHVLGSNHVSRYVHIRKELIREMDQPFPSDSIDRTLYQENDPELIIDVEPQMTTRTTCEDDFV